MANGYPLMSIFIEYLNFNCMLSSVSSVIW
jgi:hypothetical protein